MYCRKCQVEITLFGGGLSDDEVQWRWNRRPKKEVPK
jgi:hypothetical protein